MKAPLRGRATAAVVLAAVVAALGLALVAWPRWVASRREHAWRSIEAAVSARRWDAAEEALANLTHRDPADVNAWMRLGGVRVALGKDGEALAAFNHARGLGSARARALAATQAGEILLRRRYAATAAESFAEAARTDPRAVEPRRRLVYVLTLLQRDAEARAVLWELYRLTGDPRQLVTLCGLALARPDAGDAGDDLGPYLAAHPDDPWLRRARGLSLFHQGVSAEAEANLSFAADHLSHDTPGRLALAECRIALSRPDDPAVVIGNEPPAGPPPWRARWWRVRGRWEESRGQTDAAVAAWKAAVAADPRDREALYRLGRALSRRGDTAGDDCLAQSEEVRRVEVRLLQALDRNLRGESSADAFEELGRLCASADLVAEARAWYEQVVRLDPLRRSAQSALAALRVPTEAPPEVPVLVASAASSSPRSGGVEPAQPAPKESKTGPRFEDVAARAGVDFRYDCGANGDLFIGDTMGGGVALIDYDADGWLDLYFVNGARLPIDRANPPRPNRLYRNRRDGTFEDVTSRAGVAGYGYGMGCAVGDYDGDGLDDLFVTGIGRTVLYRNRGDGTFEDATARAGVASDRWTTAAGFADLDGDGDLDLVAITYVDADMNHVPDCRDPLGKPMHCPPGHFKAQADHLFRNNGDGTFTDVAAAAGLDVPNGLGLGLAIADLDGDGDLDLFVANDAAPNFFFRNDGGLTFHEDGAASGLAYDGSGQATASMGVVAEDLDGDGRIDILHTNFLNEPNTLHRNLGGGNFADATAAAGLDTPSRPVTGFGAAALDADNDGVLDLFVANGHVDDRPWVGHPMAQPPHLYLGLGKGRYDLAQAATAGPYFAGVAVGRGVAAGDLDNDGRVDLVIVHRDRPVSILRNVSKASHWVGLRLRGAGRAGALPIGARVACTGGGRTTVRGVTSGTSYLSQSDPRLWFGLGAADTVDRLEVRWPSGAKRSWERLAADRVYAVEEGRGDPVALSADGLSRNSSNK
jgi:tetratricopeptide (TPR) repeat protein